MGYSLTGLFLAYVCPSLGCILATMTFAAPVRDLRKALQNGSLELEPGSILNPFPWTFMTGNTLGWCVYAYYTADPFVLAANVPGLIMSLWLNMGAAKLQYLERMRRFKPRTLLAVLNSNPGESNNGSSAAAAAGAESNTTSLLPPRTNSFTDGQRPSLDDAQLQHQTPQQPQQQQQDPSAAASGAAATWDASPPLDDSNHYTGSVAERAELLHLDGTANAGEEAIDHEQLILVPQERALLRILIAWTVVILMVGWFPTWIDGASPSTTIGLTVNCNLIVFYGAPLQAIQTVVLTKRSDSIHIPTMLMTCCNTTFWILYGATRRDINIIFPNAMGCLLGLAQGTLCFLYPRTSTTANNRQSSRNSSRHDNDEEAQGDDEDNGQINNEPGGESADERFSIS